MRALVLFALLLPASGLAADVGATVYAVSDTPSLRFPDADTAGPTLAKDAALVVLVSEDDRLRVMSTADSTFGWIAADAVTDVQPAPDMEALLRQLQEQGFGGAGGAGAGGR